MTHVRTHRGILGVCSLVTFAEPSVRYGYACAEHRVDRRDGSSASRRRESLRGRRWGAVGESGPNSETSGGAGKAVPDTVPLRYATSAWLGLVVSCGY